MKFSYWVHGPQLKVENDPLPGAKTVLGATRMVSAICRGLSMVHEIAVLDERGFTVAWRSTNRRDKWNWVI